MRDTPFWRRYQRFWGSDSPADIEDELSFHLEMRTRALMARGLSASEARAEAARAFGDLQRIRSELQQLNQRHERRRERSAFWSELSADLRIGLRGLRQRPRFGAAVVLALALGVAASTAIFSVARAVLLRPLPYARPDRVVVVWERNIPRAKGENVVSVPNFEAWEDRSRTLESLTALVPWWFVLRGEVPERINGAEVSPNWFAAVGQRPSIGQPFTNADARSAARVVVLSDGLWQRGFGRDPSILGRRIDFDGEAYTVVGVMPPGFVPPQFAWLGAQDFWVPFRATEDNRQWGRFLLVLGRLRDGNTLEQAQAEMQGIAAQLAAEVESNRGWTAEVKTLHEQITGPVKSSVLLLLSAAGILLLIAIVNVANLVLSRLQERTGEFAVRGALGATRGRLLRQLVAECLAIGLLSAPLALAAASVGVRGLVGLLPEEVPRAADIQLDLVVLAAGFALTILAALATAVAATTGGAHRVSSALRQAGTRTTRRIGGSVVIACEVALALLLSVAAGLVARSFINLRSADLGFSGQDVIAFRVTLPVASYPTDAHRLAFVDGVLERVRSTPGVAAASTITLRPLGGMGTATVAMVAGAPTPATPPTTDVRWADAEYFQTMRIPMRAGRSFDGTERIDGPLQVVINHFLAQQLWPGQNAIGKQIRINLSGGLNAEVIGVAGDVHVDGPTVALRGTSYFSRRQNPPSAFDVIVRTSGNTDAVIAALRATISSLDANLPIYSIELLQQTVDKSTGRQRATTALLGMFSLLSLLLAAAGIYAVLAVDVERRRRELGIRLSLGATPGRLGGLVLARGLRQTLVGVVLGSVAALLLTRYLRSLLFEVGTTDPVTYAGVTAVLLGVAGLGAYLPARRAMRSDPAQIIRAD